MKGKIIRVAGQALREFWLPLIIALVWTAYRFSRSDLASVITNFSASFFLASWITGHFARIMRQQRQDDTAKKSFDNVGRQFNALNEKLQPLADLAAKLLVNPSLAPAVRELAKATLDVQQQATATSTAWLEGAKALHATNRWFLDQQEALPVRRTSNAAIFNQQGANPPWPPPSNKPP